MTCVYKFNTFINLFFNSIENLSNFIAQNYNSIILIKNGYR
jgi:hypothetical protein